jgi:5-methylcytosine-specific restriction enzyme A
MPSAPPTHRSHAVEVRPSAHARGYGTAWQRLREAVLAEDPLCRHCLAVGVTKAAEHLDHIVPKRRGGTDARANLQPLCHRCHSLKTYAEDGAFGR